jgi:hypothetical protein
MRRLPAERRLSTLIRSGAEVAGDVRHLARMLAAFHATAARGPMISAEGTRAALLGRWDATFAQLRPFHGAVLDAGAAAEVEDRTHEFLGGRDPLFGDRIASGHIVDGHADLIADDIFCLDDGPRVIDCLEFDDRLRYVDVLDDAAFLAMDIDHLGATGLARAFLDWYAEFSGDTAPAALRHHYIAYRAFVRAKVGCLRHAQGDLSAASDVHTYTDLAVRHLRAGTVRLVVVGGPPATGKTTLAGRIADRLGAVVLSSDHIRKELAGLDPVMSAATTYRQGIYSPAWTERTYAELARRARRLLERGETVVLDASWTRAAHRRTVRDLGAETHSAVVELRCAAAAATVVDRLARRTGDASDADVVIAAAMSADADPWPQARAIVTDQVPDRSADRALALITGTP